MISIAITYLIGRISHCADAVLSFANRATVVGDIASGVNEFVTQWVQTLSDYDFLVATTMDRRWIDKHCPVFSRKVEGIPVHTTYSGMTLGRPGGKVVVCHRMCREEILIQGDKQRERVDLRCSKCDSRCRVPMILPDNTTPLGARELFKTIYPPELFPVKWRLKFTPTVNPTVNPNQGSRGSRSSLHPPTVVAHSSSLPGSTTSSTPFSSLPRLRVPGNTMNQGRGVSRPRSAPGLRDSLSFSPTPPPASPHEPSPGPSTSDRSDHRRLLAPGSDSAEKGEKRRKKQKRS